MIQPSGCRLFPDEDPVYYFLQGNRILGNAVYQTLIISYLFPLFTRHIELSTKCS